MSSDYYGGIAGEMADEGDYDDDDFVQDRHVDLDPNADEAEPEPADRDWDRD